MEPWAESLQQLNLSIFKLKQASSIPYTLIKPADYPAVLYLIMKLPGMILLMEKHMSS